MKLFVLTMLIVCFSSGQVGAQEATRDEFKELCAIWQGRWIGDVIWVADWPGLGKKGDKATAYWDCTVTEDGHVLQGNFYGGSGSGTVLIAFDTGAKTIRSIAVASGGTLWNATYFKRDGKWIQKSIGSNASGEKIESESTMNFSDGGNTLTWSGSGTVDGKKTDAHRDVYRRLNK